MSASHACPARGCRRRVPDHLLMCGPHWRMVPQDLQRAVYAAYKGGAGTGSADLRRAQLAAIGAVAHKEGR